MIDYFFQVCHNSCQRFFDTRAMRLRHRPPPVSILQLILAAPVPACESDNTLRVPRRLIVLHSTHFGGGQLCCHSTGDRIKLWLHCRTMPRLARLRRIGNPTRHPAGRGPHPAYRRPRPRSRPV